jgi:hypothetical protein
MGRGRARQAIADPVAIVPGSTPEGREVRRYVGDDQTGRALDVGIPDKDEYLAHH